MEKKKTPGVTIVFYIVGILFLVVAAFMLVSAIAYTSTYLQSYGATFSDMWSNSLQYIIAQFMPYLGIGIVALGIGKVAKDTRNMKVEAAQGDTSRLEAMLQKQADVSEEMSENIRYLSENLDTTREILGIKIGEKEKRDAYRLQEMGKGLTAAFETLERKTPEPIVITVPAVEAPAVETHAAEEPAVETPAAEAAASAAPEGPVPQIFRVARSMTAPACPAVDSAADAGAVENSTTPQIFTVSRRMTMPGCGK
ncbi:MAG: hypothetical protein PUI92_02830 [Firmicutes bacterium]|nr:hypothetical protein [Bacillota bacterium]MDY6174734.1 hypothetical protein [Lentihominibacter sp.]